MDEEPSKPKGSFKVADKRRFDETGSERTGADASADSNDLRTNPTITESSHSDHGGLESDERELTFSAFVMSLATQAMMQLGELAPPEGFSIPIDVAAAKQTIDILSILQTKTEGNLDQFERQLMEEVLHNLRVSFLRRKNR